MEHAFVWCAEETTKTTPGAFLSRGLHLVTAETPGKADSWKSRGRIVTMKLFELNEAGFISTVFKVFTEAPSSTGGKANTQRRYFLLRPHNVMKFESVDMVKKYGQAGYDFMLSENFKFPKSTTKAFATLIEAMGMLQVFSPMISNHSPFLHFAGKAMLESFRGNRSYDIIDFPFDSNINPMIS